MFKRQQTFGCTKVVIIIIGINILCLIYIFGVINGSVSTKLQQEYRKEVSEMIIYQGRKHNIPYGIYPMFDSLSNNISWDSSIDVLYMNKLLNFSNFSVDLNDYDYNFGELNYYVNISNAYLYGKGKNDYFIFNKTLIYHQGGCQSYDPFNKFTDKFLSIYHQSMKNKNVIYIENGILIAQFWGKSYFHFLIEDYLRINIVYHLLNDDTSKYSIIAYPRKNDKYYYDIYDNLNLNIVHFDETVFYSIKNLIIPKATLCGHINKKSVIFWRYNIYKPYIYNKININNNNLNNNNINILYHIREPKRKRSLINNDEIILTINNLIDKNLSKVFSNKNKSFKLNTFSYKDVNDIDKTIRLHFEADIIIGPHGAGLSNLIFTGFDKKIVVIEIHPKFYEKSQPINPCFARISYALQLQYIAIFANNGDCCSEFRLNQIDSLKNSIFTAVNHILQP